MWATLLNARVKKKNRTRKEACPLPFLFLFLLLLKLFVIVAFIVYTHRINLFFLMTFAGSYRPHAAAVPLGRRGRVDRTKDPMSVMMTFPNCKHAYAVAQQN